MLTAAGFVDVGFRTVPQRWRTATADDLYEGLSRASVRMKTVFQRQTPDVQQRLRAAMREAVAAHATDDGYVLQMPAALSWAQKPA